MDNFRAQSTSLESASSLGLMVGGLAGVLASMLALWFGLPLDQIMWWAWAVPVWAVIAFPLGWTLRRRSAPAKLRSIGRFWLIAAAVPLVALLGFGKPVQKVMLEKQAAEAGK
jgi:hypothetical protein